MAGLMYSLCVFSGFGIVLNLVVLTWQGLYLQVDRGYRFVKLGLLMTYAAQCLVGIAVVCIILYRDVGGSSLCDAAGFLVLFGGQMALWSMSITTASLQLWIRRCVSREFRRRNVTIFTLVAVTCGGIVTIISVLPITNLAYFETDQDFAFTCTPLRLPGEQGWAFSTLTLILCWMALCFTLLPLLFQLSKHNHCCRPQNTDSSKKDAAAQLRFITPCVQCQLYASLALMAAGWAIVLIILSAGYSSSGHDNDNLQWVLGFVITCTLVVPPVVQLLGRVIRHYWHQEDQELSTLRNLLKCTPKKLNAVHKLTSQDQDHKCGITRYEIHWLHSESSHHGSFGMMKVYSPGAHLKWRAELNTLAKLTQKHHSNIAEYMWLSPDNNFTSLVSDVISKEASLVCMTLYRQGNLRSYMANRKTPLSDATLHNITLDVANGLEFIHHHYILHNALSTEAIYVASVSETTGMIRVVIGDFEKSSHVLQPTQKLPDCTSWKPNPNTTDLYTITQQLRTRPSNASDAFASDVQSYGKVLLDMISWTWSAEQQTLRTLETPSSIMTCTESQLDMMSISGKSNCACSTRVTDFRAHKELERLHGTIPFNKASHPYRDSLHSVHSAFHYPTTKRSQSVTHEPTQKDSSTLHDCNNNHTEDVQSRSVATSISGDSRSGEQSRSQSRPTLVLQLPDSSESESDSMVEVRTRLGKRYSSSKQILTNGSFISSSRPTPPTPPTQTLPKNLTDVSTSTDDLNPSHYVNTEPTAEEQNLTPIYEDETTKNFTTTSSAFKPPRLRSSAKGKIVSSRRRAPPLPTDGKAVRQHDVTRSKRSSLASMDGSVISADSGVGSSHYDTGSTMSDQSSLYSNYAGNRDLYFGKSLNSDIDTVSISHLYNMRNRTQLCKSTESGSDNIQSSEMQTEPTADNQKDDENIYEKLPDFITGTTSSRRRKQPCVGHHKHISGTTCTHSHTDITPRVGVKDNHISKYEQSLSVHTNKADVHTETDTPPRQCCHQRSGCTECSMELLYKKHVLAYVDDPDNSNAAASTHIQHTTPRAYAGLQSDAHSKYSTLSAHPTHPSTHPHQQHPSTSSDSHGDPCITCNPRGLMPMLSSASVKKATIRNVAQSIHDGENLSSVANKLLPLTTDCWDEKNPPSVDEIIARLEEFLPSASVV